MKKHKITITVLLALLALSAASCLFSLAYGAYLDMKGQGRREQETAMRLRQEELAELAAQHAEWRKLPADLEQFRGRHLISLDDFARFRRDLNLCLDDNGFPAPNISFTFNQRRGGLQPVSFQFTLNGTYRSLKKFIYDMERKPKMQFFKQIDLNDSGETVVGRFAMEAYLGE